MALTFAMGMSPYVPRPRCCCPMRWRFPSFIRATESLFSTIANEFCNKNRHPDTALIPRRTFGAFKVALSLGEKHVSDVARRWRKANPSGLPPRGPIDLVLVSNR